MKRGHVLAILIIIILILGLIFFNMKSQPFNDKEITHMPLDKRIESAFKPIDCPDLKYELDNSKYNGPLIDTHIHFSSIPEGQVGDDEVSPVMGVNVWVEDYICMFNAEHTSRAFVFFPVWEPLIQEQIEIVEITMEKYPDLFTPFIMPPDRDDLADGFPTVDSSTFRKMLEVSPGLFKGYGEVGLYARGDHGSPKGAPGLLPDSVRLREIYPLVKKNNLLVYLHLGEGQKESFERTLKDNPDIDFIWHGDQLISYDEEGQNLEKIEGILYNYSNAYYGVDELYGDVWLIKPEVSKEEFLKHFEDYEPLLEKDIETWKGFIERHPDQVLWGTDRGWSTPWSLDPEVAIVLNNYSRTFIEKLDPLVQEKFAYKNAEKLINKVNN